MYYHVNVGEEEENANEDTKREIEEKISPQNLYLFQYLRIIIKTSLLSHQIYLFSSSERNNLLLLPFTNLPERLLVGTFVPLLVGVSFFFAKTRTKQKLLLVA